MAERWSVALDDGRICHVAWSDTSDGDFEARRSNDGLSTRRRRLVDRPWSWLDQVHGAKLWAVESPGQHAGLQGDGLWTTQTGCPLSVTTADCAPLVMVASRGCAVVHAGWRGLLEGIIQNAAGALTAAGSPQVTLLGPCISPAAYEFGLEDLAPIADRLGSNVVAKTAQGTPALDMTAAVAAACAEAGWPEPARPACTSDPRWYSHRVRADIGRQTTVCWLEEPSPETERP